MAFLQVNLNMVKIEAVPYAKNCATVPKWRTRQHIAFSLLLFIFPHHLLSETTAILNFLPDVEHPFLFQSRSLLHPLHWCLPVPPAWHHVLQTARKLTVEEGKYYHLCGTDEENKTQLEMACNLSSLAIIETCNLAHFSLHFQKGDHSLLFKSL